MPAEAALRGERLARGESSADGCGWPLASSPVCSRASATPSQVGLVASEAVEFRPFRRGLMCREAAWVASLLMFQGC